MTKALKIPTGWKQVKIKEIVTIVSGGTPDTTNKDYWNGDIGWITPTEITKTGKYIIRNTSKKITEKGLRNSSATLIPKNSLILCSRATIGECAINTYPITTNQGFKNMVPNENVSIDFLYYKILISKKELMKIGSGSTFLEFSKKDIEKLQLLLPPLPEQQKIVEVLETWDEYLEKLEKAIILKKKLKSGLMRILLTGKVRLASFQEPWKRINLGEISQIISGGTPSTKVESYWNGDIPWVSSSDLVADNIHFINIHRYISSEAVKKSATKIVPEQSILVVSRVGVGKIAVNTEPICTSQDFQSIINNKEYFDPYFLANLLSIEIQQFLQINQGSFIKGFLKSDLENMNINLPPLEEQTAIAQILTTADQEIEALEKKRELIEAQKKFLLNNLVTGKIRLSEFTKEKRPPVGTYR